MVASMFAKGAKGLIDQWGGGGMSLPVQASTVADLELVGVEDKIRKGHRQVTSNTSRQR
jgi:hypothetical protein